MTKGIRIAIATSFALAAVTIGAGAQTTRPMSIVDLLNVPTLGDPQLAPGGRELLYVQSEADWEQDRRITHIWRTDIGTGRVTQLTQGDKGETSPRWSPDGEYIAFLAQRGDDEHSQVYLLSARGGEAWVLTEHATAVSNITWAPNGSVLYFIASDEKSEEKETLERESGQIQSLDEDYEQRHLWTVTVPDGVESAVTSGEFSIVDYALSRDGRRVVYHRAPNPLIGSWELADVWVMDRNGMGGVPLTQNTVIESGARLSPDNTQVLVLATGSEDFEPFPTRRIFTVSASGGAARLWLSDLPYEVMSADWSADGSAIFLLANMGVHSQLLRLDLASGDLRQLTDGEHSLAWTYDPAARTHALRISQATTPGDFWILPEGAGTPERVTNVYDHLAREFLLPRQVKVEWEGEDGRRLEGILNYPVDYVEGRRYPLAVQTHGGPQSSDRFGWGFWLNYTQVLTGMGYAVFKPNYRGGTGYGDEFIRDMVGHYFQNSHLDVMTGVDHLIDQGIADPDRMVKMGWSAGGHMTNKIITHTDRFKAASSGAGGANFFSFYGQSDIRWSSYRDQWFGGSPWAKDARIDLIWETSPIKDAWRVETPTIFQVGEKDFRVPAAQSVEMFRALRYHGVPTHLYIAPGEPHVYQTLRHQLFKINAELAWFEQYARDRAYVWEQPPGEEKEEGKPRT